jgi:hypothetical protein
MIATTAVTIAQTPAAVMGSFGKA